jgi:hypothetical protein
VGVEIVLHHTDAFGVRVAFLDQIAQDLGVVALGSVFRHRHMTPTCERLDHDEQVGGAVPLVLIVSPLHLTRSWGQTRTHVRM